VDDDEALSLEQVSAAAEGAGISADYVRLAHAELRLPDAAEIAPGRRSVRWARRLLDRAGAIEEGRSFAAPPARVLEAVRVVFTQPPFELVPEDSVGSDPLRDGVLVFRLGSKSSTQFHDDMNWADCRVVLAVIRPEGEGTRLTLRVPLFRRGINVALTSAFSAGGAWGGGAIGTAAAALVAAPAALLVLPVIAGAVAGGAFGFGTYRGIYRWATGGGEAAVRRLLQAVALHVQSASALALSAPPTEAGR
jgi:hypothetical protein